MECPHLLWFGMIRCLYRVAAHIAIVEPKGPMAQEKKVSRANIVLESALSQKVGFTLRLDSDIERPVKAKVKLDGTTLTKVINNYLREWLGSAAPQPAVAPHDEKLLSSLALIRASCPLVEDAIRTLIFRMGRELGPHANNPIAVADAAILETRRTLGEAGGVEKGKAGAR